MRRGNDMSPRPLRLEGQADTAGIELRHATAQAMSAKHPFKVLLSSRAPAQLSLALGHPAPGAKGSRTT
jgi:hypothetical protein